MTTSSRNLLAALARAVATILPLRATPLLFLALVIGGCASVPAPPPSVPGQQQALEALDSWTLRGRLNIRGEDEARTVILLWQQQQQAFDINLSATLGLGAILLRGDGMGVVMERGNEEPWYAEDLADISRDWLGYDYPAEHLLFWIRGMPAPDSPFTETRNETGLLATLKQGEWQLEYDRYEIHDGLALPGRISLDNGMFRLTFLNLDWDLSG